MGIFIHLSRSQTILITNRCRQWGALESKRSYPNGVNVTLMACKGLSALAFTDVPQFGCEVASSRDESVEVRGHSQRHTVSQMASEDGLLCSCLNVPQKTRKRSEVMLRKSNVLIRMHHLLF